MSDWDSVSTTAAPAPVSRGHTDWDAVSSDAAPGSAAPTQPSPTVTDELGGLLDKIGVAGPLEAAAHTATGAALSIPAGLASAWELMKPRKTTPGVLGDPSTGTRDRIGAAAHAAAAIQGEQYQPKSDAGKDITSFTDRALGALGPAEGEWLQNKALEYGASPAAAGWMNVAANVPATLLGAKLGRGTVGRTVSPDVARATGNGYGLTPQQAGAGMPSRVTAAIAGRPQLERGLSHANAVVSDNLAKTDVGLAHTDTLNDATLDRQAAPHNQAYHEVGQLGTIIPDQTYYQAIRNVPNRSGAGGSFAGDTPNTVLRRLNVYGRVRAFDAGDAVARMKALRAEANRIDSSPMYSPDADATSSANRAIADALEDALDRHVQQLTKPITLPDGQVITPSTVDPNLLNRFRDARVQLAKINNIRGSLVGPNVDASILLRQRRNGAQLTGGLDEIAHMAENFDRSAQVPAHIRDHEAGIGDLLIGLGGMGTAGHFAAAGATHPGVMAGLALAGARPLTRAAMRSRLFQRYLAHPPQIPVSSLTAAGAAGAGQSTQGTMQGVFGQPPDAGQPMEPQ